MIITDKRVIKILSNIKCKRVVREIEDFDEDEWKGYSDIEILNDEIDYLIDLFEDAETGTGGELAEAREILRRTENGKVMPLDFGTLKPIYKEYQIKEAKELVSQYRQLKYYQKKIQEMEW